MWRVERCDNKYELHSHIHVLKLCFFFSFVVVASWHLHTLSLWNVFNLTPLCVCVITFIHDSWEIIFIYSFLSVEEKERKQKKFHHPIPARVNFELHFSHFFVHFPIVLLFFFSSASQHNMKYIICFHLWITFLPLCVCCARVCVCYDFRYKMQRSKLQSYIRT